MPIDKNSNTKNCFTKPAYWQRYWDLFLFKTYTNAKLEAQTSYLGYMWWLLEPFLFLTIYYLIFGVILKTRTEHFIAFLFVGVMVWRWFGSMTMHSCRAIQSETRLIREVYVSKLLFPATMVLNDAIKFVIIFALVIIFLVIFNEKPTLLWLTVVPNFFCQMILVFGLSFCFAAVTPFFPDLARIIQTLLFILMVISGVFFNILEAPPHLTHLLQWNPLADVLINYRLPLIFHQTPQWNYMLYTFSCGVLLNILGVFIIRRNERVFAKVCS